MTRIDLDLDPVSLITTDAIGQPGQRTFYLQAWQENKVVTLLVEKVQIQSLAIGLDQYLDEVAEKHPNFTTCQLPIMTKRKCTSIRRLIRSSGWVKLVWPTIPERDLIILVAREILGE